MVKNCDAADGQAWLHRVDAPDPVPEPEPEPDDAPDTPPAGLFDGPVSMADLYPYLSPADRADYDEARRQLLHTLDHMPRNGQEAWVSEIRADLDREDLAIRRWNRDVDPDR